MYKRNVYDEEAGQKSPGGLQGSTQGNRYFFPNYCANPGSRSHSTEICSCSQGGVPLFHLKTGQSFVGSDLDAEINLTLSPVCGSMSSNIVRLKKTLHALKRESRTWRRHLPFKMLNKIRFEQKLFRSFCIFGLLQKDNSEKVGEI